MDCWKAGDVLPSGHVVEPWMIEDGPFAHQGPPGQVNQLYRHQHGSRSRSRSRDSDEGFRFITDSNGNQVKLPVWREPRINDPVLCVNRKWAEKIVRGEKILELRPYKMRKYQPGDRIFIAANADKHQGRRAHSSPIAEQNPRKSEILGSVCYSSQITIYRDEFDSLFEHHRVDSADAPAFRRVEGEDVLQGWYFDNAVQAPYPREYRWWTGTNKKGPQSWKKFQGWL